MGHTSTHSSIIVLALYSEMLQGSVVDYLQHRLSKGREYNSGLAASLLQGLLDYPVFTNIQNIYIALSCIWKNNMTLLHQHK